MIKRDIKAFLRGIFQDLDWAGEESLILSRPCTTTFSSENQNLKSNKMNILRMRKSNYMQVRKT